MSEQFEGYSFRINWTDSKPYDPKKETVEVRLTTRNGREYMANFTARDFFDYIFAKNKRTGECAGGTYFCMPNMIILDTISEENIKTTIDELVENHEAGIYFKEVI